MVFTLVVENMLLLLAARKGFYVYPGRFCYNIRLQSISAICPTNREMGMTDH
jgi:hypothetical protein